MNKKIVLSLFCATFSYNFFIFAKYEATIKNRTSETINVSLETKSENNNYYETGIETIGQGQNYIFLSSNLAPKLGLKKDDLGVSEITIYLPGYTKENNKEILNDIIFTYKNKDKSKSRSFEITIKKRKKTFIVEPDSQWEKKELDSAEK